MVTEQAVPGCLETAVCTRLHTRDNGTPWHNIKYKLKINFCDVLFSLPVYFLWEYQLNRCILNLGYGQDLFLLVNASKHSRPTFQFTFVFLQTYPSYQQTLRSILSYISCNHNINFKFALPSHYKYIWFRTYLLYKSNYLYSIIIPSIH